MKNQSHKSTFFIQCYLIEINPAGKYKSLHLCISSTPCEEILDVGVDRFSKWRAPQNGTLE